MFFLFYRFQFFVFSLIIANFFQSYLTYQFVMLHENQKKYYLYNTVTQVYHFIPSKELAFELGYHAHKKCHIDMIPLNDSNTGESIPLLNYTSLKSDNIPLFKEELNYFNKLFMGEPKIIHFTKVLPRITNRMLNSALITINGKLILLQAPYFYIFNSINELMNISKVNMQIKSQDSRLFKYYYDGKLYVLISGTYGIKRFSYSIHDEKVGYYLIQVDESNFSKGLNYDTYFLKSNITILMPASHSNKSATVEKNWTPFMSLNKIYFIYNINPFIVVEIERNSTENIPIPQTVISYNYLNVSIARLQFVSIVSKTHCQVYQWKFGVYRGGTPALLIRGKYYLAFLHTRAKSSIISHNKNVYIIGAYTFSKEIPFKLTAISSRPMTSLEFQPSAGLVSDPTRVIVFPMTFYLEDSEGIEIQEDHSDINLNSTNVVLIAGFNNVDTILMKMNLNILLDSLEPIVC